MVTLAEELIEGQAGRALRRAHEGATGSRRLLLAVRDREDSGNTSSPQSDALHENWHGPKTGRETGGGVRENWHRRESSSRPEPI